MVLRRGAVAGLTILFLSGCAHGMTGVDGVAGVSPSPSRPWIPPAHAQAPLPPPPASRIPPPLLAPGAHWTLGDLVDIGLRNSSQTRESWAGARAAAAAHAGDKGAWFPEIDLGANYSRQKLAPFGGRVPTDQRSYGASVNASWLLFNFGGRRATIDESRQALLAADWTHNAVIQNVILEVEQGYFEYTTAQALTEAEEASVKEAQANLDAAQARHDHGLATIADVLQTRTALAQAQLALDGIRGRVETARGALATAMGLPANTNFDVAVDEGPPPLEKTDSEVEEYLVRAQAERPDLASARALAAGASAHVRSVKAEGYPRLTGSASAGRTWLDSPDRYSNSYSGTLQLTMPLFTGFSHHYDVREAEAQADAATARFEELRQSVVLQVWTSYYDMKTAEQRLATSEELMKSATESHDVATGRYRAGVGSILDLLAAQSALENARATQVQARADWYLALAQLAHDTGTLVPSRVAAPAEGTGTPDQKEKP